jgi:hypothetical protein
MTKPQSLPGAEIAGSRSGRQVESTLLHPTSPAPAKNSTIPTIAAETYRLPLGIGQFLCHSTARSERTPQGGQATRTTRSRALGAVWLGNTPCLVTSSGVTHLRGAGRHHNGPLLKVIPFVSNSPARRTALQSRGVLFAEHSPLAIHIHPPSRTGMSDTYANAAEAKADRAQQRSHGIELAVTGYGARGPIYRVMHAGEVMLEGRAS